SRVVGSAVGRDQRLHPVPDVGDHHPPVVLHDGLASGTAGERCGGVRPRKPPVGGTAHGDAGIAGPLHVTVAVERTRRRVVAGHPLLVVAALVDGDVHGVLPGEAAVGGAVDH